MAKSQFIISGTVYDSTKTVPVKDVFVQSSSGATAVTDSNGHYSISAFEKDSLVFIYRNKPTLKFAVSQVPGSGNFDISLHIRIHANEKYKTLKEVKVYGKNYQQDSIENREQYARIFNYQKPGLKLSSSAYSGAVGADLDELINIFRFKRNRQLKKMQVRLEEEEKEKYVNYRFNKTTVRRITRLDGKDLDSFMVQYRPDYEFTVTSDVVNFYQYILNASYEYQLNKEKESFISSRFKRDLVKTITGLPENELDLFMKRYRPGYEFAKNSNPQEWYDYIFNAAIDFRKNLSDRQNTGSYNSSKSTN